jgi:parvulin-like peptidyl-prolyl isomerase
MVGALGGLVRMKHLRLLLALAAVGVLAAACGEGPKSVPSDAVAVVGDQVISKAEFDSFINLGKRSYQKQGHPFPKAGSSEYTRIRGQLMDFLVERAEYEQKAKELGVKVTDKQVDERLDAIKRQIATVPGKPPPSKKQLEQRYRRALAMQGLTDADARANVKYSLLRDAVFKKKTSNVKVSDGDVKDYYNKNKAQFQQQAQPQSRDVRHILVKSHALAERLYRQLRAHPERFVSFVSKYSTDVYSKSLGGRISVCKKQSVGACIRTHPPFERAAFALKKNEISRPVHTPDGWHIIQALSAVRPPQPAKAAPLSQVKEAIRQRLLQTKKTEEFQKWWKSNAKKDFCSSSRTNYQAGYKPAPEQDPCKIAQRSTTGATATAG